MKSVVKTVWVLLGIVASALAAENDVIVLDSLDAVRAHAGDTNARIRLKPGTYRLDRASARHFITLSGPGTHWDFRGVKLEIDTTLFARRYPAAERGEDYYCAIRIAGDRIVLEGLTTENIGPPDRPGLQSKNKIISITGSGVMLRDVEITTSGSSPWGYGSLFGISGGDVRKMNGIRVGWPARNVTVQNCRVHMRAMGHGIFVQGAQDTRIESCHVDGLLRPTNEILAEKSGYAFARKFTTAGHDYVEGVRVGADGKIPADEVIALSEDGIRLYDRFEGHDTGHTTIRDCTVTRMRRGICTGLGPGADTIVNCEVRDCVAAGLNVGGGDVVENCRADARYSEALSLPYLRSRAARIDLEILDSRGGLANDLLAVINGRDHRVRLWTREAGHVPATHTIALATGRGYAFYQAEDGRPAAQGIDLANETNANVELSPAATGNRISSASKIVADDVTRQANVISRR